MSKVILSEAVATAAEAAAGSRERIEATRAEVRAPLRPRGGRFRLAPDEGATAPRPQDASGRPLDAWGLPLNGPARARVLAELGRRDPVAHPEDWSGQSSTEE